MISLPDKLFSQDFQPKVSVTNTIWVPMDIDSKRESLGTSYLFKDWTFGDVFLKNGQKVQSSKIRYDLNSHLMHFMIDNEIKAIHKNNINSFILFDPNSPKPRQFRSHRLIPKAKPAIDFFEVHVDEENKLFEAFSLKLEPASSLITPGGTEDHQNRYIILKNFYIQIDSKLYKVEKNKKEFLNVFGEKQSLVTEYIKKHRLKYKQTKDLIQIIQYYNQIN